MLDVRPWGIADPPWREATVTYLAGLDEDDTDTVLFLILTAAARAYERDLKDASRGAEHVRVSGYATNYVEPGAVFTEAELLQLEPLRRKQVR
jgi:hypothetical protein